MYAQFTYPRVRQTKKLGKLESPSGPCLAMFAASLMGQASGPAPDASPARPRRVRSRKELGIVRGVSCPSKFRFGDDAACRVVSSDCGGRRGSAARNVGGQIIGSRREACVTAGGGAVGRGHRKVLVVVIAQQAAKGISRIRLTRVADASARSLGPAITAAIEVGSRVRTDDWRGYGGLDRLGIAARSPAPAPSLPPANRVASLLKRWLLGTHQGALALRISTITWTRTPSASIAGHQDRAACCSADATGRRSQPCPCQGNPRRNGT
jgi:hypothetical protein